MIPAESPELCPSVLPAWRQYNTQFLKLTMSSESDSDLHKQSINVDSFLGRVGHLLPAEHAGHVRHEAHLVQGQLLPPGGGLHDGRQEGLRVEEPREPDGGRQEELVGPGLELYDPQEEVRVPGGQTVQRGVGQLAPARRDLNTVSGLNKYIDRIMF